MVSVAASDTFHAYSDPVIFRDDRVLRTLLKKETRYLPRVANFFAQVQTEVSPKSNQKHFLSEFCWTDKFLPRSLSHHDD